MPQLPKDIKQQLDSNPHVLQMIEELARDPELLKRFEAGDPKAIAEASERAKDHFLNLVLSTKYDRDYDKTQREVIEDTICRNVWLRCREVKNGTENKTNPESAS